MTRRRWDGAFEFVFVLPALRRHRCRCDRLRAKLVETAGPSDHNEAVIAVIGLEGIVRSAFGKHDRIKFFPCAEERGFCGTTIVHARNGR